MSDRDVDTLRRCLLSLQRTAARIANHLDDLHALAYEPAARNTEPDRGGFESRPPPGWRPEETRAGELWRDLVRVATTSESAVVELERAMMAAFFAGSATPEPSRGSLISPEEHARLLSRQRASGGPVRLVEQPTHPQAQR